MPLRNGLGPAPPSCPGTWAPFPPALAPVPAPAPQSHLPRPGLSNKTQVNAAETRSPLTAPLPPRTPSLPALSRPALFLLLLPQHCVPKTRHMWPWPRRQSEPALVGLAWRVRGPFASGRLSVFFRRLKLHLLIKAFSTWLGYLSVSHSDT